MALTQIPTGMIADQAVTPTKLSQPLTQGTSVATTSGTALDLSTAIPSWVKRITVIMRGVSTSGATDLLVQVGSGSYQTTGYISTGAYAAAANAAGSTSSTAGFNVSFGNAAQIASVVMTLVNISGNVWVEAHTGKLSTSIGCMGGGDVSLSGVLDRIRITTGNGTDTFDAGSVNILYE